MKSCMDTVMRTCLCAYTVRGTPELYGMIRKNGSLGVDARGNNLQLSLACCRCVLSTRSWNDQTISCRHNIISFQPASALNWCGHFISTQQQLQQSKAVPLHGVYVFVLLFSSAYKVIRPSGNFNGRSRSMWHNTVISMFDILQYCI